MRARGLAKFLPQFGWEPTILTVRSNSTEEHPCRVVETPFEDVADKWKRRLGLNTGDPFKDQLGLRAPKNKNTATDLVLRVWEEAFCYPDSCVSWLESAIKEGEGLLRNEKFDAIVSTSPPATIHLIACELKRRSGVPWVADFRDLWVQNHYFQRWWLRRVRERSLEVRTMSSADALVTVSEPLARKLSELHGDGRCLSIPNGYDPDIVCHDATLRKDFNIVYAGVLYRGRRDPEPLLKVVRDLVSEGLVDSKDVIMDFYGNQERWLTEDVARYGLQDMVRAHGVVPKEEVLEKERESQLLLLLMWDNPEERGNYTGKVFEYLAAQRPILSLGGKDGVVAELLERTGAGVTVTGYDEVREKVMELYSEYKSRGSVGYQGKMAEIERYNHKEMAKKYSEVLGRVSG